MTKTDRVGANSSQTYIGKVPESVCLCMCIEAPIHNMEQCVHEHEHSHTISLRQIATNMSSFKGGTTTRDKCHWGQGAASLYGDKQASTAPR
eukprot:c17091_g1_i1 orf=257-532(-)